MAIQFYNHPESMKRTSIRTIILSIIKIEDDSLRKYIFTYTQKKLFYLTCKHAAEQWMELSI